MKFHKYLISILLLIYLLIWIIFKTGFSRIINPESLVDRFLNVTLINVSNKLHDFKIDKLYYINPQLYRQDKADLIIKFSNNDQNYIDSVVNISSKNGDILIDKFKKWRNVKLIIDNIEINSKFKLHGSALTPYYRGYQSYTINSKFPFKGKKKFKLITGLEFNYFNIFLTKLGNEFGLITEDIGELVSVNTLSKKSDYYMYEVFDESYLKKRYLFKDPKIFRRNTFDSPLNNWHSNELDNIDINLDLKSISKNQLILWREFQKNANINLIDDKYIGKFMALIYLFGQPHQINGNNDKWILNDKTFYPVYRNEGFIIPLTDMSKIAEELIFENYYYSSSYEVYKTLNSNKFIQIERNKAFKKLIDNKENIINQFDSIFEANKNLIKSYNEDYLKISYQHNSIKNVINHNMNIIEQYLNYGNILISKEGQKLTLISSRKNPYIINYEGNSIYITDHKLELDLATLSKSNPSIFSIKQIQIIDSITNQILKYEEDFMFINIE